MAKTTDIELLPPRENPWMVGHADAQAGFISEFERGQVHHAYLMTGPKGIGKATLAYRFARYVLAQGAQAAKVEEEAPSFSLFDDPEPTPKPNATQHTAGTGSLDMDADSPLFRRIAAGSHTDLLTLSPAFDTKKGQEKDTISVAEARKVGEFLSMTPAEGAWRVVIIDAVDQLNDNAANALLKILEEPPARAMLFLVCHQPGAALATIRSRCRSLQLSAPSTAEFGEIISKLAPSIANHEYTALYGLSYGSPGFAITLAGEGGTKWYDGWLTAMQPGASMEVRQKFADSVAAVKSVSGWEAIMHAWNIAMQRLLLYPHYEKANPILRREGELLATLAASHTPEQRSHWAEQGRQLIAQTETFNLDKRQTIRLLLDAGQLDKLTA